MLINEFEVMEHPFGYKVEYWDGAAYLTPREQVVSVRLNITEPQMNKMYTLIPIGLGLKAEMVLAFIESFKDSVEFCNWSEADIRQYAENNLNDYFAGKRGKPHPSSVMTVDPDNYTVTGLALLLYDNMERITLDLLYVAPAWQRRKLATTLVSSAVNNLYKDGVKELYSTYHICNVHSRRWHHAFGFVDLYDQFYIRQKYAWYQHEIRRHEKLGWHDKRVVLQHKMNYWHSQLDDQWRL